MADRTMRVQFLIFLMNFVIISGDSDSKVSLVFVIDRTKSMRDDIDAVKNSSELIFNTILSLDQSPIENTILITFGDPGAPTAEILKTKEEFKNALEAIVEEDGWDCPEFVMGGIKKGLEISLNRSFIYVFTDAIPKDPKKLEIVENIARVKECQIDFILTGKCEEREVNITYKKLAEATSGQVFDLHKQEMNKILNYVKHTIEARSVSLYSGKFPSGTQNPVHIDTDYRCVNTSVSITSASPKATITGPDGMEELDTEELTISSNILILKVIDDIPIGGIIVNLEGDIEMDVVVTAKSDVFIHHGFSTTLPVDLAHTTVEPIPGEKNYLLIKLFGDGVKLEVARLVRTNYSSLIEVPLTLLNEKQQLYVTPLIYPPITQFRIAAKGIDMANNNTTIMRFGRMILVPGLLIRLKVNIEGSAKIEVKYGDSIQLTCIVEAYPAPDVDWRNINNDTILTSVVRSKNAIEFVAVLKINKMYEDTSFQCIGENVLGRENKTVQVIIKQKPHITVLERPEDKHVKYMEKVVLRCRVDAFPPAHITWFGIPKWKRLIRRQAKERRLTDGSEITINHVTQRSTGTYVCRVKNTKIRPIFLTSHVTLSDVEVPKIDKNITEVCENEGNDALLKCRLLQGKPKPKIRWFRQHPPPTEIIELNDKRDQAIIRLPNLNKFETGVYFCKASNKIGFDSHYVNLIVRYAPRFVDDVTSILVRKGEQLNLTCLVDGMPSPEVNWYKDTEAIDMEIYNFRHNSFSASADFSHEGQYTCKAINDLGVANKTVDVRVYTLYTSSIINELKPVNIDTHINIYCDIDGEPKPSYKWIFISSNPALPKKTPRSTKQRLKLKNVQEADQGTYICVGSNIGGSYNIAYELKVQTPPTIHSEPQSVYKVVDGDLALKVHCTATGNPAPTISWQKGGILIPTGTEKYEMKENWLVIKNLYADDSMWTYHCLAKNDVSEYAKPFDVKVEKYPTDIIIKNTTVRIIEGERATIKCFIAYEARDTIIWYKDKRKIKEGEIILNRALITDSGVYTCRVNHVNSYTAESGNTIVVVGSKPSFVMEEELDVIDFEYDYGDYGYLNCKVLGYPESQMTWWHNGKEIAFSKMLFGFVADLDSVGKYTCQATNDFGSIHRSFNTDLTECVLKIDPDSKYQPLILTVTGNWPMFETVNGLILIPKSIPKVVLSCGKSHFKNFLQSSVAAYCDGGSHFYIKRKLYDFKDLECVEEVKPRIFETSKNCYSKSKVNKVLFDNDNKVVEAFEVCVHESGAIIYTKHNLLKSFADTVPRNTKLYSGNARKLDDLHDCEKQIDTFNRYLHKRIFNDGCCFAKRQLVNPRDVFPGHAQKATFMAWNIIPHWSTCHSDNWVESEKRIKDLARSTSNNILVYSGTSGQATVRGSFNIEKKLLLGSPIPLYIWKVIQYPVTKSSLVIIHLNKPYLSLMEVKMFVSEDINCENIPWLKGPDWASVSRGFVYCNSLAHFEDKFGYKDVFNSGLKNVLYNV